MQNNAVATFRRPLRRWPLRRALLALAIAGSPAAPAAAAPRVMSLDQCADQYVMALAPRGSIVGVSHRADDADSRLRAQAAGLAKRRATLEAAFAANPDVVVRYWGGDPRLVRALERRGVRVAVIDEASDFTGVRANVVRVAAALGREAEGARLVQRMEADLAEADRAWGGRRALYLTPGGFTAGPGTLVDAVMRAAGLRNAAAGPGYAAAPLEALVLATPPAFVLGFFDTARYARWQIARHPVLMRLRRGRTVASLPAALLGCPAWFASEGARILADAAR